MMPLRAVLTILAFLLLAGCATQEKQEKKVVFVPDEPLVVDGKKLWNPAYDRFEQIALTKSQNGDDDRHNIETLSKLSQVHYNSMIAAPDQIELRKHTVKGEVVSRIALQSYTKAKLPQSDPLYTSLLRRLALFEEKLGQFPSAEAHIQQVMVAPVKPPFTAQELFAMKMDLARMYMDARNDDKRAAALLDELLAEAKKDPKITDAHIILYDTWAKAQDRIHGDPKAVEAMRKLSKKLKRARADELERETTAALKDVK